MKKDKLVFSEILYIHANCTIVKIFPALPSALKLYLWKDYFINPINISPSQRYLGKVIWITSQQKNWSYCMALPTFLLPWNNYTTPRNAHDYEGAIHLCCFKPKILESFVTIT